MLNGEYGQTGVYVGVPCVVGRDGVKQIVTLRLTEKENGKFASSCDLLRETFGGLGLDR